MWTFAPTLALPSGPMELPRPIVQLRVQDQHDAARFKVPLRHGSLTHGRSQGGVDIAIRGQLARRGSQLDLSEPDMLASLEAVRVALRTTHPEERFGLGLFRSEIDPQLLRGFRGCTVAKFEYDLSDHSLYGYSLMVRADEPDLVVGTLLDPAS